MCIRDSSSGDILEEIAPLRIRRFNELEFPNARPVFDILLTLNCCLRRVELLEIDQHFEFVAFGKSTHEARLVRKDVDPIVCHGCEASWIAGSSPAMTVERRASRDP